MGLDAGFLDLLTHVVTLNRYTGEDAWGNNTYGANETVKTFINTESHTTAQVESQGQQPTTIQVTNTLIIDALAVKVGDQITIDGTKRYVTSVETFRDEVGLLYQTIEVGTQEEI